MRPLEGLKVLDLSRLLPGPYASLMLADLGADVVKVEDPSGGDYVRGMPPIVREQSALVHALNRNKRSIALDLKTPEGADVMKRLVASGWDVVIESFRPGVMERLGVGYEALREANARVVLCSISGYGQTGPMRDRAGHDLNYIGLAGILGFTGRVGGPPVMPGVQIADIGGGSLAAAVGVLAALRAREHDGEGSWVDISMTEGALGFMSVHLAAAAATKTPLERGEAPLSGAYPCYNVYETKDGRHVSLAALEPQFWARFCGAVDRPDLEPEGWTTGEDGARVKAEVARVFAERTRDAWMAHFGGQDVCCEPVLERDEVFDDPQLRAREAFVEVDDPVEGRLLEVATPVRFVGAEAPPHRPAPGLGADTADVLAEAGFDAAEIERLREAGVLEPR